MQNIVEEHDLEKFILIGERVLVKPKTPDTRTNAGLFLPPGVHEKEKVQSGYIIKIGPGYPIPAITDESETWKEPSEQVKYVPLQAREGDLAIYLQSAAYNIKFNDTDYVILPHNGLLMLIRDEELLSSD